MTFVSPSIALPAKNRARKRQRRGLVLLASSIALAGLLSAPASAYYEEDGDDVAVSLNRTSGALDRAKLRLYPGGRDEQDLKVQATLPQPTRALDGTGAEAAAAD